MCSAWNQEKHLLLVLSDPTEIPPPYRETRVAIPLSHCVFCGIAACRCYTPTSFRKVAYRNPKTGLGGGASQKKLAPEAYPAIGGHRMKIVSPNALQWDTKLWSTEGLSWEQPPFQNVCVNVVFLFSASGGPLTGPDLFTDLPIRLPKPDNHSPLIEPQI